MGVWDEVAEGLKDFAEAVRDGKVLDRFRVTKVVVNDDGTVKRVISDPKTGKTVVKVTKIKP